MARNRCRFEAKIRDRYTNDEFTVRVAVDGDDLVEARKKALDRASEWVPADAKRQEALQIQTCFAVGEKEADAVIQGDQ